MQVEEAHVEEVKSMWKLAGKKVRTVRKFQRPKTPLSRKAQDTFDNREEPELIVGSTKRFDRNHHRRMRRCQLALKGVMQVRSLNPQASYGPDASQPNQLRLVPIYM